MADHPQPLLASQIYAISQGLKCEGKWRCHWCSAPCSNEFIHDDPPPIPFARSTSAALCPGNSFICRGCWAWRRTRITVTFLHRGQLDRQQPKHHAWYITENGAWGVDEGDYPQLWEKLLQPPLRFVLALKRAGSKDDTLLQLCKGNDPGGVVGETVLWFTIDNVPHQFTPYELGEAIKAGSADVYGPGVRALFGLLGEPPAKLRMKLTGTKKEEDLGKEEKRERGRPAPKQDAKYTSKKVVVASGNAA